MKKAMKLNVKIDDQGAMWVTYKSQTRSKPYMTSKQALAIINLFPEWLFIEHGFKNNIDVLELYRDNGIKEALVFKQLQEAIVIQRKLQSV